MSKAYDFLRGIIESSFGRATPSHVWTFSEVLKGSHVIYWNSEEYARSIVFQSETEFDNCAPSLLDFFRVVDGIDWRKLGKFMYPDDDVWLSPPQIYFRATNGTVTSRPTMAPTPLRVPPGIVAFAP